MLCASQAAQQALVTIPRNCHRGPSLQKSRSTINWHQPTPTWSDNVVDQVFKYRIVKKILGTIYGWLQMTIDCKQYLSIFLYLYMSLKHSISFLLLRAWFWDPSCLVCLPFIQLWTIELGRGKHTTILPSSHLEPGWSLGVVKGPCCTGYLASRYLQNFTNIYLSVL